MDDKEIISRLEEESEADKMDDKMKKLEELFELN